MKRAIWVLIMIAASCRHMPSTDELESFSSYLDQSEQRFLLRSVQIGTAGVGLDQKISAWDSLRNEVASDPLATKKVRDSIDARAASGKQLLIEWHSLRDTWSESIQEGKAYLDMCRSGHDLRRIELRIPQKVRDEIESSEKQSLTLLHHIQQFPYPGIYTRKPIQWKLPSLVPADTIK